MKSRVTPRKMRRKMQKKRNKIRLIAVLVSLALLLIALGTYFVVQYRRDLRYAMYPLRYKALIVQTAQEYGLEPWHVAAVIRCESSFDPNAVSSVGARGLMQIMPETGEWLAKKFGEQDAYTEDVLFDPETNLKYGCWYLSWLKGRFHDDLTCVTAAYHAGQGTVQSWINNVAYSDDGVTLARIPYATTATYVQRVLTAYDNYKEMYDYETT